MRCVLVLLALTACPGDGDEGGSDDLLDPFGDTDADTDSDTDTDSSLPAGIYGGEHYEFTVYDDRSAFLEGDCAHASVPGPVEAPEGHLLLALDWVSEGGPVPETGWTAEPMAATLEATVSGGVVDGTLTVDEWPDSASAVHVVLGEESQLYKCM